jgi:23S rRNA pseudouridine2457 synthase
MVGVSLVAGRQPLIQVLLATGRWSANQLAQRLAAGRVRVNGRVLIDATQRVDPWRDAIVVDEQPLPALRPCRYLAFHKPHGVLSSFTDPEGRATLADYVSAPAVYAVGRLDYDSEGLMLLTDDGWLNHRLAHPRYEHPKTYLVQVDGAPDERALEALRAGVVIQGWRTASAEVALLDERQLPPLPARAVPIRYRASVPTAWLRIVLREGAKRQVRHMTAAVGLPTLRLIRMAVGPLELGDLAPGAWRDLDDAELGALREWFREHRPAGAPPQPRSNPKRRDKKRRTVA